MYEGKDLTAVGGMAVGTPGELRGLEALHQAHGKLAWAELFQPAIKLARDGFACNEDLHWVRTKQSSIAFEQRRRLILPLYRPSDAILRQWRRIICLKTIATPS